MSPRQKSSDSEELLESYNDRLREDQTQIQETLVERRTVRTHHHQHQGSVKGVAQRIVKKGAGRTR